MAIPNSADARLFYRCALLRSDEAQVLFKADFTTGAVYLAGYGIECILKALVLTLVPASARVDILKTFRGGRAHDYEWLRTLYLENGGARFPRAINESFTLVNDWSTNLRYAPRQLRAREAGSFLRAAEMIIRWAKERM